MKLKAEEISNVIKEQIQNLDLSADMYEQGIVVSAGDGIVKIYGLSGCEYGEIIVFENGENGLVLNLEEQLIGAIIIDDSKNIKEGSIVKRTKNTAYVPVSAELLGRVIDPLGKPLDNRGEIKYTQTRPIENPAPGIIDRKAITRPLQTGIIAIDSMIPIGKGQRELIIGDKQTGKTTIGIDTIINQKDKDVVCIYVAIGQKASDISTTVDTLKRHDALNYTIIIAATASDSPAKQYISPYSGCAIAEYFMYEKNKDVLIVYDDLSKHAIAYRTISLLLRRPPGREAYPGDVFYIHSRLLERAGQLNDDLGGGSITAIPIVETLDEDISSYIPTNIISITDGQIHLDTELFHSGHRPAVNAGLSVSRVGGAAQTEAMKKVSGSLRINLAQYRDLEIFSQFGSELDKVTKGKIEEGEKLLEILKQHKNSPMNIDDQVIILYTALNKFLIDIPLKRIKEFNENLIEYINRNSDLKNKLSDLKNKDINEYIEEMGNTISMYKKESWDNNV